MKNAEWMIQNGYKLKDIRFYKNYMDDESWDYGIEISKASVNEHVKGADRADALLRWLAAEHVEPILDDVERKYLYAVIKPFRDRAIFVKKIYHTGSYEQIIMRVKSIATDTDIADITFPFFNEGEMYKGMELNKEYTLKELGL